MKGGGGEIYRKNVIVSMTFYMKPKISCKEACFDNEAEVKNFLGSLLLLPP